MSKAITLILIVALLLSSTLSCDARSITTIPKAATSAPTTITVVTKSENKMMLMRAVKLSHEYMGSSLRRSPRALQHLPFSPATIWGIPHQLVVGDTFPQRQVAGESSQGIRSPTTIPSDKSTRIGATYDQFLSFNDFSPATNVAGENAVTCSHISCSGGGAEQAQFSEPCSIVEGMEIDSILCPNCGKTAESTRHVFFACSMGPQKFQKFRDGPDHESNGVWSKLDEVGHLLS
ncbi:hypothetical protein Tco_0690335 [Tanacetum coccineum]